MGRPKKIKQVLNPEDYETSKGNSEEFIQHKFEVNLNVNGQDFESSGDSVFEAIGSITVPKFKTRGIVTIKNAENGKSIERLMFVIRLKRLFGTSIMTKKILAGQLEKMIS